jgi:hypothetical protein
LVLVPGSGLGRLACEIACDYHAKGYAVQACESGGIMCAVADLMIQNSGRKPWTVYPFLHDAANRSLPTDQARAVTVPDTSASALLKAHRSDRCLSNVVVEFVDEYLLRCN